MTLKEVKVGHVIFLEQNIELVVTEEAKKKLAELGYDKSFGARPLRRVIMEYVEDGITDLILSENEVKKVLVEMNTNKIVVRQG